MTYEGNSNKKGKIQNEYENTFAEDNYTNNWTIILNNPRTAL